MDAKAMTPVPQRFERYGVVEIPRIDGVDRYTEIAAKISPPYDFVVRDGGGEFIRFHCDVRRKRSRQAEFAGNRKHFRPHFSRLTQDFQNAAFRMEVSLTPRFNVDDNLLSLPRSVQVLSGHGNCLGYAGVVRNDEIRFPFVFQRSHDVFPAAFNDPDHFPLNAFPNLFFLCVLDKQCDLHTVAVSGRPLVPRSDEDLFISVFNCDKPKSLTGQPENSCDTPRHVEMLVFLPLQALYPPFVLELPQCIQEGSIFNIGPKSKS